ncbi:methylenetetrahydrofolate--tRNA-(uracil(54)-C(5))-methyltransferase (FADH(2)-oxidizing) TrmFO, partial [bacterium DOLZORAL124_64_63]
MSPSWSPAVTVVGAGLAGCEAALQLACRGVPVQLVEMRPETPTPAHQTGDPAEIVCSNSLKSTVLSTASGCLKQEMELLGCRLLQLARAAAVPAGAALAVDKAAFSRLVREALEAEPLIRLETGQVRELPARPDHLWLVAGGPLSSPDLIREIGTLTGQPALHFFDAIAPTVTADSLDTEILFRAARYDKGDSDYWNAPLDQEQYESLHRELLAAERAAVHDFDRADLFDGCQPIEEIAASGPQSLAFGPLRPVGLKDPRTGRRPHAVIQLRQENLEGTLYGLVGFQTRLKFGEQKRVFRQIPGLAKAEFVRYGQMHRNFYLDTPRCLAADFSLPARPDVFLAGQITGVEGYVESMASGLVTALRAVARLRG